MADHKKPESLKKFSSTNALQVSGKYKAKWLEKIADKASRTDCLALQQKRIELEKKVQFTDKMIEMLVSGKDENGEPMDSDGKTRLMNLVSLSGMSGMLRGMCLLADCLTEVSACKIKQPDGTLKPGRKRISLAENLTDIHDMMIDGLAVADMHCQITHDIAYAGEVWKDDKGVNVSPYQTESNAPEKPKETAVVEATDQDALPVDAEDAENVDLRIAKDYVKTGKANTEGQA